jgi:hypothetical protein
VAGISDTLSSKESSDTVGSFNTSNLAVGRSEQGSPLLNTIFTNEFHSDNKITADEFSKLLKEGFSL